MFKRQDVFLISDPVCYNLAENLTPEDFKYYDKDGFELNLAERKFYAAMNYPLIDCLNHICWQEPWFQLETATNNLILDHSMFLCRACYGGAAYDQIKSIMSSIPQAQLLLNTRPKWGYDFALDGIRDGELFEVLHVEYDSIDYEHFGERFLSFEYFVRHADWVDAADRIWAQREQWQNLKGFEQNDWKARYLLNWRRAESTEKAVY